MTVEDEGVPAANGKTYKPTSFLNFVIIGFLLILMNLMTFGQSIVPTNVEPIQALYGMGPDLLGAIVAGYTITHAIVTIFFGYFADKFRRIYLMAVGSIAWGFFAIFTFLSQTFLDYFLHKFINCQHEEQLTYKNIYDKQNEKMQLKI